MSTAVCDYQLLCHIDSSHVSARSNKFTEGIAVSSRTTAEVQDPAALKLSWKWQTTAKESAGEYSSYLTTAHKGQNMNVSFQ